MVDIDLNQYYDVLDDGLCKCKLCNKKFSKYGIKNHIKITCLCIIDAPCTGKDSLKRVQIL